jgi:hypothetical protein
VEPEKLVEVTAPPEPRVEADEPPLHVKRLGRPIQKTLF